MNTNTINQRGKTMTNERFIEMPEEVCKMAEKTAQAFGKSNPSTYTTADCEYTARAGFEKGYQAATDDLMPVINLLCQTALKVNGFAAHDDLCESNTIMHGKCDCGYGEAIIDFQKAISEADKVLGEL